MRASPFEWTEERLKVLETLYLREGGLAEVVAAVLGCSRKTVVRKASELGWGLQRRNARRAARKRRNYYKPVRRDGVVGRSDAELIAEALQAGRVKVVPAGMAAGLSAWERATGYAAPPPGVDFNGRRFGAAEQADQAARRAA